MGGCVSTEIPKIISPPAVVATRVECDRIKDVRRRVSAAVLDMPSELVALVVAYCDFTFLGRLREFEATLNGGDMNGFACAVATAYQPVYVIHVPTQYESKSLAPPAGASLIADAILERHIGTESRRVGLASTPAVAEKSRRLATLLCELLHEFPAARLYAASGFVENGRSSGAVDRSVREFWLEHTANSIATTSGDTVPTATSTTALPTATNHPFPFGAAKLDRKQSSSALSSSSHDVPAILTFELGKLGYALDRSIPTPRFGGRLPAVLEHRPLHWVYGDEFKRTSYSVCGCLFRVRRVALLR